MRFLGLNISRAKDLGALTTPAGNGYGGGWFSVIREPFTGAFQRGISRTRENILTYHAVYSCITLIASDVAKCCIYLMKEDADGIWTEVETSPLRGVLDKPNNFQNRIKFFEQWIISKLLYGNTYVLKVRDGKNVVSSLYILDPSRVKPVITPAGEIYYVLGRDVLAELEGDETTIPASEIIHDVMVPLYHPLCGVSPLTASGVAAVQGLTIQRNSTRFFENGSQPSGILTAPGQVDDTAAERLKTLWEEKYTGENAGRVAVLGNGLKYEAMTISPVDAQLIEQLKWSAEVVCSTFHVPAYKVGVGAPPSYSNIEALEQQYYSQCLQKFFECIELCLDEGLELDKSGKGYGTQFDLDDLLRMDTATLIESEKNAVAGGIKSPNESRKRLNLPKKPGGDSPYLQQQNFSLEALAKRDAQADPFANKAPPTPAPLEQQPTKSLETVTPDDMAAELERQLAA